MNKPKFSVGDRILELKKVGEYLVREQKKYEKMVLTKCTNECIIYCQKHFIEVVEKLRYLEDEQEVNLWLQNVIQNIK